MICGSVRRNRRPGSTPRRLFFRKHLKGAVTPQPGDIEPSGFWTAPFYLFSAAVFELTPAAAGTGAVAGNVFPFFFALRP